MILNCPPQVDPLYCSIDLVPVFRILAIGSLDLAKIVNEGMLGPGHPEEWFDFITGYVGEDKVMMELFGGGEGDEVICHVLLKLINCYPTNNYFIRPSQLMTQHKFHSPLAKKAYCYMKALKKVLGLNFSQYLLKKQLLKPVLRTIEEIHPDNFILYFQAVLSSHELKSLFEERINFSAWGDIHHKSYIPLRPANK